MTELAIFISILGWIAAIILFFIDKYVPGGFAILGVLWWMLAARIIQASAKHRDMMNMLAAIRHDINSEPLDASVAAAIEAAKPVTLRDRFNR